MKRIMVFFLQLGVVLILISMGTIYGQVNVKKGQPSVKDKPMPFKTDQKRYSRVREAYADKALVVSDLLVKNAIDMDSLNIYLCVYKSEQKIALWAKNNSDSCYAFIKEFEICSSSGVLGPKRKQGDYQVPEGFYFIDRFNPYSSFYLSLGINYPNASDRILGESGNLGDNIFIHGDCVTIGCLPITNDKIKELYIFCTEAKNAGQAKIMVSIFPKKLTEENYNALIVNETDDNILGLWEDLKSAYDFFIETKTIGKVRFLGNGRHRIVR